MLDLSEKLGPGSLAVSIGARSNGARFFVHDWAQGPRLKWFGSKILIKWLLKGIGPT